MKKIINTYLNTEYLLSTVSQGRYENFYLYFPLILMGSILIARIYLFIKGNRIPVFRAFDRLWFWGGLAFSMIGLFIWFSRTQGLPIFSTRAFSYGWLLVILLYCGYLTYYWKKKIPVELERYYETNRKKKYLK